MYNSLLYATNCTRLVYVYFMYSNTNVHVLLSYTQSPKNGQDLKMGEEDGVEMTKNKNNNVTGPIHWITYRTLHCTLHKATAKIDHYQKVIR